MKLNSNMRHQTVSISTMHDMKLLRAEDSNNVALSPVLSKIDYNKNSIVLCLCISSMLRRVLYYFIIRIGIRHPKAQSNRSEFWNSCVKKTDVVAILLFTIFSPFGSIALSHFCKGLLFRKESKAHNQAVDQLYLFWMNTVCYVFTYACCI